MVETITEGVTFTSMTGSQSWDNHSAKAMVFHCLRGRNPVESPIGLVSREGRVPGLASLRTSQGLQAHPQHAGLGTWHTNAYRVPANTVLKVFGKIKKSYLSEDRIANQFILVRPGAAVRRLRIELDPVVGQFRHVDMMGAFDLITVDQARARTGLVVDPRFRRTYDERAVNNVFDISVLEPETVPIPNMVTREVVDASGEVVPVTMARRRRLMTL